MTTGVLGGMLKRIKETRFLCPAMITYEQTEENYEKEKQRAASRELPAGPHNDLLKETMAKEAAEKGDPLLYAMPPELERALLVEESPAPRIDDQGRDVDCIVDFFEELKDAAARYVVLQAASWM
mmetsp:Transcript_33335/g.93521  ORF Transcript_33335/g.93521 Transcript_33335/m.93521 type:complete len:125 (-) Transcript_33335:123-497(-)